MQRNYWVGISQVGSWSGGKVRENGEWRCRRLPVTQLVQHCWHCFLFILRFFRYPFFLFFFFCLGVVAATCQCHGSKGKFKPTLKWFWVLFNLVIPFSWNFPLRIRRKLRVAIGSALYLFCYSKKNYIHAFWIIKFYVLGFVGYICITFSIVVPISL